MSAGGSPRADKGFRRMDDTVSAANAATPPPAPRGWLARWGRWLVLGLIVALIVGVLAAGGGQRVREHWGAIQTWVADHYFLALGVYFLVYVVVTGLSIPVANVLTVGAGMLFGRWVGIALISFASTAGATLAFLGSRYLFRDAVRRRLGPRFDQINQSIEREGAFYLFTLRLMIVVPFWMVNLASGLTTMRVWTFWWVSQLGMLPATFVYLNAGVAATEITDVRDVFTWQVILAFALLGVVPLALRWVVLWLRSPAAPR